MAAANDGGQHPDGNSGSSTGNASRSRGRGSVFLIHGIISHFCTIYSIDHLGPLLLASLIRNLVFVVAIIEIYRTVTLQLVMVLQGCSCLHCLSHKVYNSYDVAKCKCRFDNLHAYLSLENICRWTSEHPNGERSVRPRQNNDEYRYWLHARKKPPNSHGTYGWPGLDDYLLKEPISSKPLHLSLS